jgi:WD40 repeat protein
VWSAGFSPDGKRVVTASDDNTARVWDADSGKEIALLKGHYIGVSSAGFSPDGKRVVTERQHRPHLTPTAARRSPCSKAIISGRC